MIKCRARGCSTPFGINRSLTSLGSRESFKPSVLNAFRHQSITHVFALASIDPIWRCSTPFGINRSLTGGRGNSNINAGGSAQRLSASIDHSQYGPDEMEPPKRCAQRLSASIDHSPVTRRVFQTQTRRCAQRLSASIDHSHFTFVSMNAKKSCAQRLSASIDHSPQSDTTRRYLYRHVLNAFRHQSITHRVLLVRCLRAS